MVRAALLRGSGLFGLWVLLAAPTVSPPPAALAGNAAVGFAAAFLATWVSLRLLPPRSSRRLRWGALARLVGRFLWQSVVAGVDIARRVFDPRLPLNTGIIAYPMCIPPGPGRAVFGALTSLVPGTLPVGTDAHDAMVYHCLDRDQPVAVGLAKDEALLRQGWGEGRKDD